MKPLLEVEDLDVVYKGRGRRRDKVALTGVSLQIQPGATLGLVGESGSGKSTLGGCVLGLVDPAKGRITFDGTDITHLAGRQRRRLTTEIQAVFQDPYSSFNPHRTIEQTVGETLTNEPGVSREERRSRSAAMLERVGLDKSALDKFPAQFSGGQRQRIAIARALLPNPRLVVCDESVSALDLSVQAQVLNLLLELQRERDVAYLFITHDLAVVRHVSNRIAVLEHGRLVEEGPADQVTDHPRQPYTKRLIAASPQPDVDLQDARRASRRALAGLSAAGDDSLGALALQALHSLEAQAVCEVLAQPLRDTTVLDEALSRCADEEGNPANLVRLRAAIVELSPRTASEMLSDASARQVSRAREDACHEVVASGQTSWFAAQCRELSRAIGSGSRTVALSTLDTLRSVPTTAAER